MTFRYSALWAYIEFAIAAAMALAVYAGLHPEWWGWLMFSPLFLYLVFEGVRKSSYSLTIDGDLITVGGISSAQYSLSKITAVNVWNAKGKRIAVVAFADGRRFNFPSRIKGFDELTRLLASRTNLPLPS
jgi:hypothetical protein